VVDVETRLGSGTRMALRWPDPETAPVNVPGGIAVASPVPVQ
jgi:hypothetical protein